MKKINLIHFVGIKGVGMTGLAVMAHDAGIGITGSDVADSFITDEVLSKNSIRVFEGFDKSHIKNIDLVITTGAHGGLNNLEVLEAKKKGIKVITHGEAVGLFMDGRILGRKFFGISVCGTNGKTTTTAMLATILQSANLDPSYLIGTSTVYSLGFASHLGKGDYFVAEADEYATDPILDKTAKFLWQSPKIIVLVSIDFDHPDVYKDLEDVKNAFRKFIKKLPKDGLLVVFGDDHNIKSVIASYSGEIISCGFNKENDYIISDLQTKNGKTSFLLSNKIGFEEKFELGVFGEQNAVDASLAIIAGKEMRVSNKDLQKGIANFKGSKRRSEYVGRLKSGALMFDDYAHNPSKVAATLKAFRSAYPDKKIICIFQPHTYSRTKYLFEQFSTSFKDADIIVLVNIYASLREKPDLSVSSKNLAQTIQSKGKNVIFLPNLSDVVEYVNKNEFGKDCVIITMGAGDVYKISSKLKVKS